MTFPRTVRLVTLTGFLLLNYSVAGPEARAAHQGSTDSSCAADFTNRPPSGTGYSGTSTPTVTPTQTPTVDPVLAQNLASLISKFEILKWAAYAPTNFNPTLGCPLGFPTEDSMRADLELLRNSGFSGIISFAADCTLSAIPRLARDVGFEGVVMGLFMVNATLAAEEIANAVVAAAFVDGYGVGNEGLVGCGGTYYDQATLVARAQQLRVTTHKPVTTSEQIEDYVAGHGCLEGFLRAFGDWAFPITHPFNNGIRDPTAGVDFTESRFNAVNAITDRYVFFKETGWPTGPTTATPEPGATEANQAAYFRLLATRPVRTAYFEAFDQPWKTESRWEPFWGLFHANRSPKAYSALFELDAAIHGLFGPGGRDWNEDGRLSVADIVCILLGNNCPSLHPVSAQHGSET